MGIFNVDGPVYRTITRFWDLVKLSFFWFVCSLPVLTFGPATVAAFTICLKMTEDKEGYIVKPFFAAFKKNLKGGIPLGLLFLGAMYSIYLDTQCFKAFEDMSVYFLIAGIIVGFVIYLSFVYAFALMARYENKVIATIKNSYNISVRYFLRTLLLLIVLAIELIIIFWNYYTIIIGVVIGPGLIIYTISTMAMRFFREIEKEPGAVSNPEDIDEI